jgi:hypothetical protein
MATHDDEFMHVPNNAVPKLHASEKPKPGALIGACHTISGFWPAATAALMSGGVMMAAGYLLRTAGSGTASLATIPGGVLIVAAFALARPYVPATRPGTGASLKLRIATHLLKNFGLPDDLPLLRRVVALSLTTGAGAVMVFAGYVWAAQSWKLAVILAVTGGLLITAAFGTLGAGIRLENRRS